MRFFTIIATALLLSSEACAAQVLEEAKTQRLRKVKIYSSSSIRRGELSSGDVDPYLGLPDEREERHLQEEGGVSVAIASMPDNLSFSLPTSTTTTTEAPAFCIEIYKPVCGEDGITYSNDCFARLANVAVSYEGECLKEIPESPATATVLPII
ncbi:hypothetical protein QTG54_016511 [Skeletonema marinoi]|uniref:Kazal-like domain-containing protein n=1 Tax=Skeletonema marinoi TaxID=267567 RepID=A0AAD8XSK0_9STRA|nr:hypothetical protein QTG54_016511 [Skeletonema marinoi]